MVSPVKELYLPLVGNDKINEKNKDGNSVFKEFYQAAINLVEETNKLELEADQKTLDFAMGKNINIEDVLIAQGKADTLLQFTIQVRNKAVESYKEIMRMPL